MFKLKSVLLKEASRSRSLSFQEASQIYTENCKEHTSESQEIYRGTSSNYQYGFIDPSNYTRSSTGDVGNHYTLLIDNLPSWSSYPKRSKSVICTMDRNIAEGYGNTYVTIPFDNEKVAVAPTGDIWYAFQDGIQKVLGDLSSDMTLPRINIMLDMMYDFYKGKGDSTGLDDSEFSVLWGQIKEVSKSMDLVEKNMERYKSDKEFRLNFGMRPNYNIMFNKTHSIVEKIIMENKSLVEMIKTMFNPELNGVKLKRYKGLFETSESDNEVWISGPCLLIETSQYETFLQKVGE